MKPVALLSLFGLSASLAVHLPEGSSAAGWIPQTKRFELNATWGSWAADGVKRQQTLINGQFPGPPLILDEGDNVEVTVNNFMPFNTTIHYHGIEQLGSPWSDGVPGVSQKLIPPGGRFFYAFKVQQHGTYWYHSHSAGQIMDGFYGPIFVRPREIAENLAGTITNDTLHQVQIYNAIRSPILVMLSDWFHQSSEKLRDISIKADIDPLDVPPYLFDECTATNATEEIINVDPLNGWASLNFIGSASISALIVSINNHSLWVYEIDGLYIKPTKVDALTINNGGRYSCLIKLNQLPGNYPITVANSGFNQKIAGFASLSYLNGDPSVKSTPSINYGGVSTSKDVISFDETKIQMLSPSQPKANPDETYILTAGRIQHAWEWSLNGNHSFSLALEATKPFLWDPVAASKSPLVISTKNNTWVDIIFDMSGEKSTLQPSHPLHKHSNRVYVLGSGTGAFNWTSVAEASKAVPESFNLINPPMRDTFTTLPAYQGQSWLAVRYHANTVFL
ncbi:hypothetical protein N7520_011625 [Penicillium odoratum]|uniref:uncharacterized protein n=1 Tax=Penicillium odoratum TaxID=1167516 RepID=UPI002549B36F|nr:uncharacterized protein N7520_011625 [Penicillium odoratum]KAJ5746443.1 hypothetical protein N7520_011625 [Penicillium odoratum]